MAEVGGWTGDLRDVVVPRLLELSNRDDEHLQSMLFATGYLQAMDKAPPWACMPLPHALGNLTHETLHATHYGPATAKGCVPVTELGLRVVVGAWSMAAALASWRVLTALKRG